MRRLTDSLIQRLHNYFMTHQTLPASERLMPNTLQTKSNIFVSPAWIPSIMLFIVCLLAFYPGFMSPDSINQFAESLSLHFTDWHPPLMAAVWSVLNTLIHGPFGMLFLQLGFYWGSLFILADMAWRRGSHVWWLWLLFGLLPCTLNFIGVIWKDVGLAVAYLAAAANLLCAHTDKRKPNLSVLVLILYGIGMRWNGLPAALPLIYWWFMLRYPKWNYRICLISTVLAGVFSVVLLAQVSYKVLRAEVTSPWQILILHDLAAVGCGTGQNLIPTEFVNANMNTSDICAAYTPMWNDPLFAYFANPRPPLHYNSAKAAMLPKIWLHTVLDNPRIYIEHRSAFFAKFLRIGESKAYFYLYNTVIQNAFGISHQPNALILAHAWYINLFESSFILKPWFWCVLATVLLVISVRRKILPVTMASVSGLVYVFPYWFIGPTADLRYSYWLILSTTFAAIVLIMHKNLPNIAVSKT